jgi:hypothetical protein
MYGNITEKPNMAIVGYDFDKKINPEIRKNLYLLI